MNKLKYIPGDLCIVKGKVESVCEVDRDNDFSITTDQHPFIRLSEVKPIPIVPAILEKNGWEVSLEGTWIYEKEDSVKILRLLDDKHYAAYIGDVRLLEFQYTHELQHLLFGLGLNSEMEV